MEALRLYSFTIAILFCVCMSISCQDKAEPVSMQNIEIVDEERAALNYRNHCGGCHGQNFSSFIERDWVYGNSADSVLNSIKIGNEQNGMPAYGNTFTEEELIDLTNYLLRETEGVSISMIEENAPNFSSLVESTDLNFRLETITDQIDGIPWGMEQLPNGEFLVNERSGKLYLVGEETELIEISGVPNVVSENQGGLLDVILHPDFINNSYIYFSYSIANPNNSAEQTTAVTRAKLSGNSLIQTEEIFIALPYLQSTLHFGSRLLFDADGYLYISVGDRGARDQYPQTLDNFLGKIHRVTDTGQVPSDNPFYNEQGVVSSVFAYGIRNPQGLALHPVTGEIWEGEHGPQGGDEINIIEAGNNYGWPVITYGINYTGSPITDITEMEGMEQPIHYWVPSIAPCGMTFLSSDYYKSWKNDLFVSSLKFEYLHRLKMNGNVVIGEEELLNDIGRVREVYTGNDGYMYILVENPGRLIRLVPEQ